MFTDGKGSCNCICGKCICPAIRAVWATNDTNPAFSRQQCIDACNAYDITQVPFASCFADGSGNLIACGAVYGSNGTYSVTEPFLESFYFIAGNSTSSSLVAGKLTVTGPHGQIVTAAALTTKPIDWRTGSIYQIHLGQPSLTGVNCVPHFSPQADDSVALIASATQPQGYIATHYQLQTCGGFLGVVREKLITIGGGDFPNGFDYAWSRNDPASVIVDFPCVDLLSYDIFLDPADFAQFVAAANVPIHAQP